MRTAARWLAFLACIGVLFPLQASIDAHHPKQPSGLIYTPDRRLMKLIACGHGCTLADLVWVQSTNYVVTEFHEGKQHIEHLYALYDVLTELDPNFTDAYILGAVFLSSVAEEPERALELLEKGQGVIIDRDGVCVEAKPRGADGYADPDLKDRWRLLNECAATHLVAMAGHQPSLDERMQEVRLAGRLYCFGAKRYPVAKYPTVPDWFEAMGVKLAVRTEDRADRTAWYYAVRMTWDQRLHYAAPDSPIAAIAKRRIAEIDSRDYVEQMEKALAYRAANGTPATKLEDLVAPGKGGLTKIPEDPLGVGYFLVDGAIVAPALDSERAERDLAHLVSRFQRRHDRFPVSLDELHTDAQQRGDPWPKLPAWVEVAYDPATGTVTAKAVPSLVHPPDRR